MPSQGEPGGTPVGRGKEGKPFYIFSPPPASKEGTDLESVALTQPLSGGFLLNSLGIILINIVLSGDNSVVIAMAVHELPRPMRIRGIVIGTVGAVLLRVLFTPIASHLLGIPFLKLFGGVPRLLVAGKLPIQGQEGPGSRRP